MTAKTIMTIVLSAVAVFVFVDLPMKTLIDLMLAVFVVAMFRVPKEDDDD